MSYLHNQHCPTKRSNSIRRSWRICLPSNEYSHKKDPRDPPSSKLVSDVAKPPLCLRLNRRWFRPPGDIRGGDEMETDVQRTLGVQTFGVNCIAFSLFSYI